MQNDQIVKPRPITKENPYKIVFVCLGNICRSPTGEGVMQHLVNERDLSAFFEIDSAGTSAFHTGEPANSKSQATANKYGVVLRSRARQFETFDLDYFDLILAMDSSNYNDISYYGNNGSKPKNLQLLREYDPEATESRDVPDPYYGGMQGFENVFKMVQRSCNTLLNILENQIIK